jgi:multidrug resistance efflux pump
MSSAETATPATVSAESGRKSHRMRRLTFILLFLLLIGAAGWWFYNASWTPPWVETDGLLVASGSLEADEVLIGAEVAGRIVELIQEGDNVDADQVVAKLDDSLIQLQMRQADTLHLQQLQIIADRYQLQSPISGVVTRVPMHVGEVTTPGQTVAAVSDLSRLDLTVYVLERDLGRVQVGQEVIVTVDPFPDREFHGVVTSTNQRAEFTPRNVQTQADRLNLVFGVKVRVDNPDGTLKPGMPADATFPPLP